jgi:hypothetical protein
MGNRCDQERAVNLRKGASCHKELKDLETQGDDELKDRVSALCGGGFGTGLIARRRYCAGAVVLFLSGGFGFASMMMVAW